MVLSKKRGMLHRKRNGEKMITSKLNQKYKYVLVNDDEKCDWPNENPRFQVVASSEKGNHHGYVSFNGQSHRGVDRARQSHLRYRYQVGCHVNPDFI